MTAAGADGASETARVLLPFLGDDEARFGLDDVARISGLDQELLRDFWRALGFPDPRPGERLFTEADVEMLSGVIALVADGSVESDVARQFARVIGSSVDRIAAAQIDAWLRTAPSAPFGSIDDVERARRSLEVAAIIPRILELVWRRRLRDEARRRLDRDVDSGLVECVGFADLVGFTAQTQQLDTVQLADVVSRFEAIAYDVIPSFGGRVVKTIGDEVMFVVADTVAGCRIALELARRYRVDEELSDVRVGLAMGPVLERDGDIFGHTVNLASRIVSVAFPGSVVISESTYERVAALEDFTFTPLHMHFLKGIGRVPLWRLRGAGEVVERRPLAAIMDRDARQRESRRRWEERNREFGERSDGGVAAALRASIDSLPPRLAAALAGTASPEELHGLVAEPTPTELRALAETILDADLDPDLQIDILTEIVASTALRGIEAEADRLAAEADQEAEEELRRIESETAAALDRIEAEHRARVSEALDRAAAASRAVDEATHRRQEQVAASTADRAEQVTRAARVRARRAARQRARRRDRG